MDFCLFILGNGRKGYLERTVASWEANLIQEPKHKIIFDDSGDARYLRWLNDKYGDRFTIVPIGNRAMGQNQAIRFIFDYISNLDVDYVVEIEEDWMLNRPLDVNEIINVLEENPHIVQMRIPRVVWYAPYHVLDINAGSLLQHHMNIPGTTTKKMEKWYEWRGEFYFWSHNPSVFRKSICTTIYNNGNAKDHELMFGKELLADQKSTAGFWATNPYDAYITHIGIRDDNLLKNMPSLV
jgi:hypothetical protein